MWGRDPFAKGFLPHAPPPKTFIAFSSSAFLQKADELNARGRLCMAAFLRGVADVWIISDIQEPGGETTLLFAIKISQ